MGSGNSFKAARAVIDAAAEQGVGLIDTADTYASTECESWLGELLRPYRRHFAVATKAGCPFAEFPSPLRCLNQLGKKAMQFAGCHSRFDGPYLTRCIDGSLRRLRREAIDIFFLHDPPVEAVKKQEWLKAIEAARSGGKLLRFGVSSPLAEVHRIAADYGICDVGQMPLPIVSGVARTSSKPIIVNHVFGGQVSDGRVGEVAATLGMSSRSLILAYAARLANVTAVLTRTSRPEHLRENVLAVGREIPAWAVAILDGVFNGP